MELRRRPAILLGDQSAGITLRLINFTSSLLPSGCVCASERLQRGQTERRVHIFPPTWGTLSLVTALLLLPGSPMVTAYGISALSLAP